MGIRLFPHSQSQVDAKEQAKKSYAVVAYTAVGVDLGIGLVNGVITAAVLYGALCRLLLQTVRSF